MPDRGQSDAGATGDDAGRRQAAEDLFLDALDQPDARRAWWIEDRSGDDRALAAEALALLNAHVHATGFLAGGAAPTPAGRAIGPYRVVRELGRGGMGVVYLAERADGQFDRQVAIKLLRNSADVEELQQRFGAERQILASLNHPNIAQLLDGGVSEGELPYLVMEFVDGVTLTEYARRERLTVGQRLELFADVCAAVDHAHRNLVIHRDLKPGNILVTRAGQVKLLDFGIAKLLDPARRAPGSADTRTGFRVLTPEYASPEQVRGSPLGTASDIYSLGVLLYELLCGRLPYRTASGDHHEVLHAVVTEDPPPPSDRLLDRDGPPAAQVAAEHGTTVDRLRRILRRDLDAIPLMALRKETGDRYASVQDLASDLRRFLDGEPLHAHRGSGAYRLRKFLRRRRLEVSTAAVAAASLLVGTGVAIRQARVAGVQRDLAAAARDRAELALREARAVTDFLVGMFDVNYPEAGRSTRASVDELLRRGDFQAERLAADPSLQARLLETMGRVNASVGDARQARTLLERALQAAERAAAPGSTPPFTTMFHLVEARRREGSYFAADSLSQRARALRERSADTGRPDLVDFLIQASGLRVYFGDLEGSDSLSARALALRERAGTPDSLRATAVEHRAAVLRRRGRRDEAMTLYARAISLRERALGPTHVSLVTPLLRLAEVHAEDEPHDPRAEALDRRAIDIAREGLGERHPQHATTLLALAFLLDQRGDYVAAESVYRHAIGIQDAALGAASPVALDSRSHLGRVLANQARFAEAEAMQRQLIARLEARLGPTNPYLSGAIATLGYIQMSAGDHAGAERSYQQLLRQRIRVSGDSASVVGLTYGLLGSLYLRTGRLAAAETTFHAALARMTPGMSVSHPEVRRIHGELSRLYRRLGRDAEATRHGSLAGGEGKPVTGDRR